MSLDDKSIQWYVKNINNLSSEAKLTRADESNKVITYPSELRSDESNVKSFEPEELVHATIINLLCSKEYEYDVKRLYHEQYFAHGSIGSLSDEVDLILYDEDDLPYAVMEFKSSAKYSVDEDKAIKFQLFGTAPLIGSPKLLVYGTVHPNTDRVHFELKCIDYVKYKSYESWEEAGKPYSTAFPKDYQDLNYVPFVNGGARDLKISTTQADFRAVANSFHNEFFGEHPDNALFINLVKCLLAKIYDERTTKKGDEYSFQVKYKNGKPEKSSSVFEYVNNQYKEAYSRYIEKGGVPDEIDPKEFSKEKVKSVVLALESLSITKGAALHGDVIGAFFEEILRSGFKQDKGMYFTHSNLVRFMIEALDLEGLTKKTWKNATHPENRLPYVIDPACGSGAFLLHAMNKITSSIKEASSILVSDFEETQFYKARMSDEMPNYWAENFIYGFDPKFIMAITSKVNMVLHGDGSAHMFKYDAFKPFSSYNDTKLRPSGDKERSIPRSIYDKDVCETFDAVLSNPPFGVTLSTDTKRTLSKTFSLSHKTPSDGLFIERAFQLLKPGGRLGVVLPESIFNAVDLMSVRIFIYRMFHVKAIVSLPRNVFIDTPTLTSLLFAQKKSGEEISRWDEEWQKHETSANELIKKAKMALNKNGVKKFKNSEDLQEKISKTLENIIKPNDWVYKKGKNAEVLQMTPDRSFSSVEDAASHYNSVLNSSGLSKYIARYAFTKTATKFNTEHHTYIVNEVGFKLSKRKEKPRPNQLVRFVSLSGDTIQNLHLCEEDYKVEVSPSSPEVVLDFIKRDVVWS
ncbi:N-6 DNA methylase [Methylophaga sp.]|uniref:restriction endonuclease subunit M n=1 Tax=Methylophaga sp. TaxID=2024840 RepID=UPI00271C60CC|nr:N-6 DNA methylase [Methylophaga sp.]MDO8825946.1 N-6 DNA methylase [Methylophaga sp.]